MTKDKDKLQQLVYFQWVIIILIMAVGFAIVNGIKASNEIKQIRNEYKMKIDSLERRHAEEDFERAQAYIKKHNDNFQALAKLSSSNLELSQKLKTANYKISKSAGKISALEKKVEELGQNEIRITPAEFDVLIRDHQNRFNLDFEAPIKTYPSYTLLGEGSPLLNYNSKIQNE